MRWGGGGGFKKRTDEKGEVQSKKEVTNAAVLLQGDPRRGRPKSGRAALKKEKF